MPKIERQAKQWFSWPGKKNTYECAIEQDLERRYIRQTKRRVWWKGALLYIDLDDLSISAWTFGHQYGDVLLKNIQRQPQRIPGVTVYRMGRWWVYHHTGTSSYDNASADLRWIKSLFTKRPWMLKRNRYYYCTLIMGVVRFPAWMDTVEELIKKQILHFIPAKCREKSYSFNSDNVEVYLLQAAILKKRIYTNATTCIQRIWSIFP